MLTTQRDRFPGGRTTVRVIAFAAVGIAALGACSSSSSSPAASSTSAPDTSSSSTSHVANVTITQDAGCQINSTSFPAGALTVNVENQNAPAVSEVELQSGERIVGERENLPPGFKGNFTVDVDAGNYILYCPGAKTENTSLTVTGTSPTGTADDSTTALLNAGVKDYASYVTAQTGYLLSAVKDLNTALHGNNLKKAQAAYDEARPFYEKIEPVAETFVLNGGKTNLDANIDARINDVPRSQWTGFHPIEQLLFQKHTLSGTQALGNGLVKNVKLLAAKTKGLTYRPYQLANGAQDLLEEVASSKITGEEERYSLIDLLDFQANDEGAEQAFADLQPALAKIDNGLAATIAARFKSLDTLVDTYRTGSNPSGFVYYSALNASDKRKLAAAVTAVQEPLSQVASKVARA